MEILTRYSINHCSGFFDIHPPLGKFILAYGGYWLGYRPNPNFAVTKIGQLYPEDVQYELLRYIAVSFSICTVPLTYLICRALRISRLSSALPTAAVLLDFIGVIEGRLVLMDSQVIFFCQVSLLCALKLWQTVPKTLSRWFWVAITGAASGTAFAIKHTALATPGLIAVVSFFGVQFLEIPLTLMECAVAAVIGLSVYTAPFFILFKVLWKSGEARYNKFMPLYFRQTLVGSPDYDPKAGPLPFFRTFAYLNKRMIASNAGVKKKHSWESDWYHWITNWRGILYYVKNEEKDGIKHKSQIYLIGNPAVLWLVLVCGVGFALSVLISVRYRRTTLNPTLATRLKWVRSNGLFLLSGWLCNILPYILVVRSAFIYHYLPGLFYGQLLCGVVSDALPVKIRAVFVTVTIGLMVMAYWYWSAWIYGFFLPEEVYLKMRWLPRWN